MSTKTIVVIGATGNQGSSVARTFLSLPNWHVRAVSRNPSSPAAQSLASLGATIVQADLSDLPSLSAAFQDAHAIFVNTDFWGPYRGSSTLDTKPKSSTEAFNEELQHGKNAARAASAIPTLERYVYSALGPMKKHSGGKYSRSYHWESKAAIVEYIESEQPELAKKTSYFYAGAYATNPLFMPRWNEETGGYQFIIPMERTTKIPVFAPEESTGPFVRALIENEEPGTKLLAYDSYLTIEEIVEVWSRATGHVAELVPVTTTYMNEKFGIPWEVLEGAGYIEEYGYMGGIEGFVCPPQLKVRPETRSLEDWLRGRDWEQLLSAGRGELASVKD